MARILVTGSADGLGRATADTLLTQGHDVIVHARNADRAKTLTDLVDRGAALIVADLSKRQEVLDAAHELNDGEAVDAVIHNAGVYSGPAVIPVNVVAPYLFTALLRTPTRHVVSQQRYAPWRARRSGPAGLGRRAGLPAATPTADVLVTTLALGVARRWAPTVLANAVDPGWVPTKMGGAGATDDFDLGHQTQERLVTDHGLTVTGGYWFHDQQQQPHPSRRTLRFRISCWTPSLKRLRRNYLDADSLTLGGLGGVGSGHSTTRSNRNPGCGGSGLGRVHHEDQTGICGDDEFFIGEDQFPDLGLGNRFVPDPCERTSCAPHS